VSRNLKASRFQKRRSGAFSAGEGGYGDYDADFLRFTLPDGAGAVVLETSPRAQGLSLRIEWIDLVSHAHEFDTCMYVGANKEELRAGRTWLDYPTVSQPSPHEPAEPIFLIIMDRIHFTPPWASASGSEASILFMSSTNSINSHTRKYERPRDASRNGSKNPVASIAGESSPTPPGRRGSPHTPGPSCTGS
jgi:hypothetical protein